jgi:hypothetical protein
MENGYYGVDANQVLRFQHRRIITALYVSFLETLEDLQKEHNDALGRLYDNLPESHKNYVDLADNFNENRLQVLRKRILDRGNAALRELEQIASTMDIQIK